MVLFIILYCINCPVNFFAGRINSFREFEHLKMCICLIALALFLLNEFL